MTGRLEAAARALLAMLAATTAHAQDESGSQALHWLEWSMMFAFGLLVAWCMVIVFREMKNAAQGRSESSLTDRS